MTVELGTLGAYQRTTNATPQQTVELEKAGYGTLWLVGSPPADLAVAEQLLDATEHITVATGIVNIWTADAQTVAASYHRLQARHPDRFLLGVGIGHRESVAEYTSPYDTVVAYLDQLAAAEVPADRVVLAALGPRMLRLARERTAGTVPYLVTPEHTRQAREILGADRLVLPGVQVVLDTDVERARATGRAAIETPYLNLVNYTNNLRRIGFTDADLTPPGSDHLVDEIVPHGDADTLVTALVAHLDAGADHVGVAALGDNPLDTFRTVADGVAARRS
jgi:probable F420-dependent oxidoreductase